MQYSKYDLNSVSNFISKMYRYKFELMEINNELDLRMIKNVTFSRNDSKNITLEYAKDHNKLAKLGDMITLEYNEPNKMEIINLAKSKLDSLTSERTMLVTNNERLVELTNLGIIKGSILECKVSKILPLGDIVLSCDRIPDIRINMTRDQLINEVYDYESPNTIYVIITRISVIGSTVVLNASRRSTQLVKELVLQSTLLADTDGIDLVSIARIPDRGSRIFIKGPFSRFLGKSGSNVRGCSDLINREFIRFLPWDCRLPQLVINSLQYDCTVLDIYFPEETPDRKWHLVISESEIRSVLKCRKEPLVFTKLLTGVQPWIEDECYLSIPHKEFKYEGIVLDSENEVIKRYYAYKFDDAGIKTDEDLIKNYKSVKVSTDEIEYIKNLIDQSYSGECPECGAKVGVTSEYCPECGISFIETRSEEVTNG